jgi:S1-C subfamily serine protease
MTEPPESGSAVGLNRRKIMNKKSLFLILASFVLIATLASCSVGNIVPPAQAQSAPTAVPAPNPSATTTVPNDATTVLTALETTLEQVYNQVNPSVVYIEVVEQVSTSNTTPQVPGFSFGPNGPQGQQQMQGQGSGFVWDAQGDIVTNDHVVANASDIQVTFSDGTTVAATLVGADPSSDLAVVKVDVPAAELHPIQVADSTQVKVGELSIAIGNPYGFAGSMTVGFVSGVGRSLPAQSDGQQGAHYSIPDVIQTDAAINPGNSGGVLVNDAGQLIGVTSALESSSGSNSGVGFAIPSSIVQKVVPALIQTGHYDHPWLGLSGTTLTPDLAQAMGLKADQRGALVMSVVADGPSAKAGLLGSDKPATINGQQVQVGGDVIVAIDGTPIKDFDGLIAYLSDNATVGQTITLTVLRQGQETSVSVTLGTRPNEVPQSSQPQNPSAAGAYLGIRGLAVTPDVAQAMGLTQGQQGVLVEQVVQGSPAEQAGLRASDKTVTINGQSVQVGGDIITAMDGQAVNTMQELQAMLAKAEAGQKMTLTLLRDGQSTTVDVTLAAHPSS